MLQQLEMILLSICLFFFSLFLKVNNKKKNTVFFILLTFLSENLVTDCYETPTLETPSKNVSYQCLFKIQ